MDTNSLPPTFPRFEQRFLEHLQAAADRHLLEKGQIRDTLGLLRFVVLTVHSNEDGDKPITRLDVSLVVELAEFTRNQHQDLAAVRSVRERERG